jgi:hypothetical protein
MSVTEYNRVALEWINSHGLTPRPCPLCGTNAGWQLLPPTEAPIRPGDVEGQLPGKAIPLVPLMCNHCAHVMFLSAIAVGVVTPVAAPEEAEAAK